MYKFIHITLLFIPSFIIHHPSIFPQRALVTVQFGKLTLSAPSYKDRDAIKPLTPHVARLRNLTYSAALRCELTTTISTVDSSNQLVDDPEYDIIEEKHDFPLCNVPIMLRSKRCILYNKDSFELTNNKECPLDQGGYFIVNGSEKVIVGQERAAANQVMVYSSSRGITAEIRSMAIETVRPPGSFTIVMVPASKDSKAYNSGHVLLCEIPQVKEPIPLFTLFRALGFLSDYEIIERICYNIEDTQMIDLLRPSMDQATCHQTQEVALEYIGCRTAAEGSDRETRIAEATKIMNVHFLPHIGSENLEVPKSFFLGYMVHKMLATALKRRDFDDRDHFGNKRVDFAGSLLAGLFRQLLAKTQKEMSRLATIDMKSNRSIQVQRYTELSDSFSKGLAYALATGNWTANRNEPASKTGVSQVLNRLTFAASLSHLRRSNSTVGKEGKLTKPRQLHNTQWGMMCVTGDSEVVSGNGMDIVLIKELADGSHVTTIKTQDSMQNEPSAIMNWFEKPVEMVPSLLEITLADGRVIKADPEHPLWSSQVPSLVSNDDDNATHFNGSLGDWVKVKDLVANQHGLLIQPQQKYVPFDASNVSLDQLTVASITTPELAQSLADIGLVGEVIPIEKLVAAARLLGLLLTDGYLGNKSSCFDGEFYVGEKVDADHITSDFVTLGFNPPNVTAAQKPDQSLYPGFDGVNNDILHVTFPDLVGAFFFALGACRGNKQQQSRRLPQWLLTSSDIVKREFLASFFGGDGSRLSVVFDKSINKYSAHMDTLTQQSTEELHDDTMVYVGQVCTLLSDLGIESTSVKSTSNSNEFCSTVQVSSSMENLIHFYETIGFRYCSHKKTESALALEYMKTVVYSAQCRQQLYEGAVQSISNEEKVPSITSSEASATHISWDKFSEYQHPNSAGHIWIPIVSIKPITPEPLYDFTTVNDNHSFYVNSIISHNCPAETPEGQACGIVKNMSLMCTISVGLSAKMILQFLADKDIHRIGEIFPQSIPSSTKVIVDGNWIGITMDPERLVQELRQLRSSSELNNYDSGRSSSQWWQISIVWNIEDKEVKVYCDPGRMLRPLYVLENSKLKMNKSYLNDIIEKRKRFPDLVSEGVIEYVDTLEEESSLIAMMIKDLDQTETIRQGLPLYKYTHCEIHPSMILGVCASIIPFPDHNQSPRNTYQSAMGKQAMGVYTTNFVVRMDTLAHVFYYPQKPLVVTNSMEYIHFKEMPAGTMAIVAIGCYTGYNQEDSVIMNQSSIDRGLYRSAYFRTYSDVAKQNDNETFGVPVPSTTSGRREITAYDNLDEDGLVQPGRLLSGGQVIIGKTSLLPESHRQISQQIQITHKDASTAIKHSESGICDQVMVTTDADRNRMTKVRLRCVRVPQIGDKFASRHGQKGTCGMTFRQEDMPFNIEGIVPDIIINPHAIPSRMTIGHLIECLVGKVAALDGSIGLASPFLDVTVDDISRMLHSLGYQMRGNEIMYSGFTGAKMEAPIFFGPTFYQRLKHLVDDKIHARTRGRVQNITRQPTEGRSQDGGLRFGEMERDCMISHGAANVLRDRLFISSDLFSVHVCDLCGLICKASVSTSQYECKYCKNTTKISRIEIPYAAKLLFQELMSMCIVPRMFTQPAKLPVATASTRGGMRV